MHRLTTLTSCLPLLLLSLTGCGMVSPPSSTDYASQAASERSAVPHWPHSVEGAKAGSLYDLITAAALQPLVSEALQANPGLQQTLLTLKIRQAELRQTRGAQLPGLEAGFAANKEEESDSNYTGSLTISWEVDLWQKLANNTAASAKDLAQQAALYQAARDTLAAEVIKAWLALVADQHAIAIETRRLATLAQNETFLLQRYRNGLGTLEDLDSARSSTASSRASLEAYRETLYQDRSALMILLGRSEAGDLAQPDTYPQILPPLADLPEQTLQRRPDLRAAFLAVEAADLRTSVAYKDMLPAINLEAALTDLAESPEKALFTNPLWSLLGQLTAPLFQGGQLRAAAEVAELETAQAYQAYRETLLTAVREVSNGLSQERSYVRQQQHLTNALASARDNLSQYQQKYRAGLATILELLDVQQQTYDLEAQLDTLLYNRLVNRIDLGLALGLGVQS